MEFLCYTMYVNTGRNVIANWLEELQDNRQSIFKNAKRFMRSKVLLPFLIVGASACSSKDDPGPTKGVDERKVEHNYDVGVNIRISDASSNYFKPTFISKPDGTDAYGFNASVDGLDKSRLATGASSADNTKFSMRLIQSI